MNSLPAVAVKEKNRYKLGCEVFVAEKQVVVFTPEFSCSQKLPGASFMQWVFYLQKNTFSRELKTVFPKLCGSQCEEKKKVLQSDNLGEV